MNMDELPDQFFSLIGWILSRTQHWTELINCNINEVHVGWAQTSVCSVVWAPESNTNIL